MKQILYLEGSLSARQLEDILLCHFDINALLGDATHSSF